MKSIYDKFSPGKNRAKAPGKSQFLKSSRHFETRRWGTGVISTSFRGVVDFDRGQGLMRNKNKAKKTLIDVNPVTFVSGRQDGWSSPLHFVDENVYILRRGQDRRQERISLHGTEPGVAKASPGRRISRRTADISYNGVINIPGYSLWAEDVIYLLIGQVTCERTLPLSDCVLVPLVRPWSGTILLPR